MAEKTDKQRKKAGSGRRGEEEAEKERRGEGSWEGERRFPAPRKPSGPLAPALSSLEKPSSWRSLFPRSPCSRGPQRGGNLRIMGGGRVQQEH